VRHDSNEDVPITRGTLYDSRADIPAQEEEPEDAEEAEYEDEREHEVNIDVE
jgi:hypothetical protein